MTYSSQLFPNWWQWLYITLQAPSHSGNVDFLASSQEENNILKRPNREDGVTALNSIVLRISVAEKLWLWILGLASQITLSLQSINSVSEHLPLGQQWPALGVLDTSINSLIALTSPVNSIVGINTEVQTDHTWLPIRLKIPKSKQKTPGGWCFWINNKDRLWTVVVRLRSNCLVSLQKVDIMVLLGHTIPSGKWTFCSRVCWKDSVLWLFLWQ